MIVVMFMMLISVIVILSTHFAAERMRDRQVDWRGSHARYACNRCKKLMKGSQGRM